MSSRSLTDYVYVGRVGKPHGLDGSFVVEEASDAPERFAPGAVLRVCCEEGVRCVVFGGRVALALEGAEMRELSGEPGRARDDLARLGEELAGSL